MCFCCADEFADEGDGAMVDPSSDAGLLMFNDNDAGGPTETILEPNSTPMVTS